MKGLNIGVCYLEAVLTFFSIFFIFKPCQVWNLNRRWHAACFGFFARLCTFTCTTQEDVYFENPGPRFACSSSWREKDLDWSPEVWGSALQEWPYKLKHVVHLLSPAPGAPSARRYNVLSHQRVFQLMGWDGGKPQTGRVQIKWSCNNNAQGLKEEFQSLN